MMRASPKDVAGMLNLRTHGDIFTPCDNSHSFPFSFQEKLVKTNWKLRMCFCQSSTDTHVPVYALAHLVKKVFNLC